MIFLEKLKGGERAPAAPSLKKILLAGLGGIMGIGAVAFLAQVTRQPLVLGSFGASCVLLFGFPESPFSQPRNVLGGHVLASLIGLLFLMLFGSHWWSMALAAGTAISAMMLTRTVHPPAGSNPVIVMLSSPGWGFLLTPTLIGAIALVIVSLLFNNLESGKKFPKYWY